MNDQEAGLLAAAIAFLGMALMIQWAFIGLLKRVESLEGMLQTELNIRQTNDERMSERLFSIAEHIKANMEKLTTPRPVTPKPESYYIELFPDDESRWAFVIYRIYDSSMDKWSATPLDERDHGQEFEWHPTPELATAAAVALLEQVKKADTELYAKWAEQDKANEAKWKDGDIPINEPSMRDERE